MKYKKLHDIIREEYEHDILYSIFSKSQALGQ